MNVLELFAGSCSFSNAAKKLGFKTFTVDKESFKNIDLQIDVLDLTFKMLKEKMLDNKLKNVDIIFASPPCTFFSVASIGHHWFENGEPKTKEAELGIEILNKTLDIFKWFPDAFFYMENPVGKMRKKVKGINRTTITYCSYGDKRMKPTDIWSNNIYDMFNPTGWIPKPQCFNGNIKCHHESAPRGSATGTQGIKGNYERSKIPNDLCNDILKTHL